MYVKIFDENHEEDLEDQINEFLDDKSIKVIDIKYNVAMMYDGRSQIYSFSAMIVYDTI